MPTISFVNLPEPSAEASYSDWVTWHFARGTRSLTDEEMPRPWTKRELAREIGCNVRTVENWVGRVKKPRLASLKNHNALKVAFFGSDYQGNEWYLAQSEKFDDIHSRGATVRKVTPRSKKRGGVNQTAGSPANLSIRGSHTPAQTDYLLDALGRDDVSVAHQSRPMNLPFITLGSLFMGRDAELRDLDCRLNRDVPTSTDVNVIAVFGTGGVGKTRLAAEFAIRHQARFSALLFVTGHTPADLYRSFADLASADVLALAAGDDDRGDLISRVRRWMNEHPSWLLIVDNVATHDVMSAVIRLVASLQGGSVICTGSLASYPAGFGVLDLQPLDVTVGAAFLLQRTAASRYALPQDARLALTLSQELGGFPSGLEHAGAYIAASHGSLKDYLDVWRRQGLPAVGSLEGPSLDDESSVSWKRTIDKLGPLSRRLIEAFAYFGADPIPEEIVTGTSLDLQEARRAVAQLHVCSLITRTSLVSDQGGRLPAFTIPPLVQDFVKRSLSADQREEALRDASTWLMDAASPGRDPAIGGVYGVATLSRDYQTHLEYVAEARIAHAEATLPACSSDRLNIVHELHRFLRPTRAIAKLAAALEVAKALPGYEKFTSQLRLYLADLSFKHERRSALLGFRELLIALEASIERNHHHLIEMTIVVLHRLAPRVLLSANSDDLSKMDRIWRHSGLNWSPSASAFFELMLALAKAHAGSLPAVNLVALMRDHFARGHQEWAMRALVGYLFPDERDLMPERWIEVLDLFDEQLVCMYFAGYECVELVDANRAAFAHPLAKSAVDRICMAMTLAKVRNERPEAIHRWNCVRARIKAANRRGKSWSLQKWKSAQVGAGGDGWDDLEDGIDRLAAIADVAPVALVEDEVARFSPEVGHRFGEVSTAAFQLQRLLSQRLAGAGLGAGAAIAANRALAIGEQLAVAWNHKVLGELEQVAGRAGRSGHAVSERSGTGTTLTVDSTVLRQRTVTFIKHGREEGCLCIRSGLEEVVDFVFHAGRFLVIVFRSGRYHVVDRMLRDSADEELKQRTTVQIVHLGHDRSMIGLCDARLVVDVLPAPELLVHPEWVIGLRA